MLKKLVQNIKIIFLGCFVGIVASLIVSLFLKTIELLSEANYEFIALCKEKPIFILLFVASGFALCFVLSCLQKFNSFCKGSGIPLAESAARGKIVLRPINNLATIFVGTCLSTFAGLCVGAEGPSIGIGGNSGALIGKIFKQDKNTTNLLISAGACAGLATAFNAPLSGICFAFEEVNKKFTSKLLLVSLSAMASAVLISHLFVEDIPYLQHLINIKLEIKFLPLCVLCGIVCGFIALLFNNIIFYFSDKFGKIKSNFLRLLPAFVLAMGFSFVAYEFVGSGSFVLGTLDALKYSLGFLIAILIVRLMLTSLASSCGATGGLFIPMLAIGGIIGMIFSKIFVACGMDQNVALTFVTICLVCFFASTAAAPLTAIVLAIELVGSATNILPIIISVSCAYFVTRMFGTKPLYEFFIDKMTKIDSGKDKKAEMEADALDEVSMIEEEQEEVE